MAEQIIHLKRQHFPSLQVGDIIYKSGTTTVESTFNVSETSGIDGATDPLNPITTLTKAITVEIEEDVTITNTDFLFFSKDNIINKSSIVGYYGSANFVNNNSKRAELYSVGCEISESSK